ncbi:serine/threonine-protein kinase [Mycobacterium heidelbergense]|uniref:serine/threonine-protein kinase n=1 Tax=Mycobacterium heidelbergense TaxID=53376 RepID=UPI003CF2AA45
MPLSEGAQFAGYTLVRLLGTGGMGEVYLARHPRFPRHEALKVLRADVSADPDFQQRFNREAELASRLWHPHIVGVHDRGEFEGQLWITMDYVDGTDLGALVGTHYHSGMPVEAALSVVNAVSDALDYAHHRGLLHRDVKPANIMVSRPDDGSTSRILLSDFGIARPIDDTTGLTVTNMAVGTVNYSAPEQLMGAALDGRADQYALAATAYYLLTGTKMFCNLPAVAVISAHLTAPPPLPGAIRPDLASTDAVFARALAKDPRQRFERCADFAAALADRLRIGHYPRSPYAAVQTAGPGDPQSWTMVRPGPAPAPHYDAPSQPRPRTWSRRWVAIAAAAVICVAAVAAYLVVSHGADRHSPASSATAEGARLAAQNYLEALSRGDAATALSLSANPPATREWVSADALRAQLASAPITDITVTSAPPASGDDPTSVQHVILSARFGSALSQARIAVRRNGNDWKLDTATVPVDIGTPGTTNASFKAVALFGIATNGTTPVSVFPGALVVSSSNRFVDISAQAAPVLLNALAANATHPSIQPVATLNDTGLQAAKAAVDNWEKYCYHGVAPPPECGHGYSSNNTGTVTSAGDFSQAKLTFDPTTMVVAVSGTIKYTGTTSTGNPFDVTYNPGGTVDLTKDPPTYTVHN